MTKNYLIFTEQPWVIGDLRKTLINHVLQVQHEYDEDDDDEKEEDTDEDLDTTGNVFGPNYVLGQRAASSIPCD